MTPALMRRVLRPGGVLTLLAATSCANGATSSTPAVQTANIAQTARLQFGVGTARIAYSGGTFIGTNFVATFRGSNGHSATLANTPTITGPPGFVLGFPGSPNSLTGILPNALSNALTAYRQGIQIPTSFGATFGSLVGVFGYGMAADNLLSPQVAKQLSQLILGKNALCEDLTFGASAAPNVEISPPISGSGNSSVTLTGVAQSQELGLPMGSGIGYNPTFNGQNCPVSLLGSNFAANNTDPNFPVNYYGGPPAWPSPQGYGNPLFFVGYPLGFTDFAAPPVAGKYSLDVAYATNSDSTAYGHFDAGATLRSSQALPPIAITRATINGDGTGSVVMNVPPGLFEAIVFVRTFDCDPAERSQVQFDNYAVVTHSTGIQNFVFSAALGPPSNAGQPTPTFCKLEGGGYNATAYAVGFDYSAYEGSYPFDVTQTPKITNGDGHTGQADVTTSAPFPFTTGF